MRGYFGVGVQGISKARNLGAVMRTAHAFGASFVFSVNASDDAHRPAAVRSSDTSRANLHLPYYSWDSEDDLRLPEMCPLVGIELCDRAVELPSFRHPKNCAYILGPEDGSLSETLQDKCTHIVKIPTKFCINVSLAAALALYDRTLTLGGYPERPVRPGGPDLAEVEKWRALRIRGHV